MSEAQLKTVLEEFRRSPEFRVAHDVITHALQERNTKIRELESTIEALRQEETPTISTGQAESLGEAKSNQRDEHLCYNCLHFPVCKVPAALGQLDESEPGEMLVTITACLGFINVG